MAMDTCGICGGDGRITNSFAAASATCPGCHGTGRRAEQGGGFRDVTKTKPSHHRQHKAEVVDKKPQGPSTFEGTELVKEVQASPNVSSETKAKLTREIIEYEMSHGQCTRTFVKKIRVQLRPPTA